MDIEKLAREAGFGGSLIQITLNDIPPIKGYNCTEDELRRLIEAVRRETAEEAAKVCEASRARVRDGTDVDWQDGYNAACDESAYAIRERFKAS